MRHDTPGGEDGFAWVFLSPCEQREHFKREEPPGGKMMQKNLRPTKAHAESFCPVEALGRRFSFQGPENSYSRIARKSTSCDGLPTNVKEARCHRDGGPG